MATVNAMQYVKNVGRSLGYSTIDAFKDLNPQVAALASGAMEFSSDLYQSIKDFTSSAKTSVDEKSFFGKGKDYVAEARDNLFDDLKTGNWYNRARIDKVNDKMMEDMFGFSMSDFDFDLDNLDNFDLDDDDVSSDGDTAMIVSAQKRSTDAIVNSMDAVGAKTASAISSATVRSADYIVSSQKQSDRALYALQERGFRGMTSGIAALNANVSALVALGEPLTKHMQNSATFYTTTTQYQQSVLQKLDTIIKNTAPPEKKTASSSGKKNRFSTILNSDGTIDLGAWFSMIKDNVKSAKEETFGFFDMFGGGENLIKSMTAAPMKYVSDMVIKNMIPNIMKESMKSFNEALSSFFPSVLQKIQKQIDSSNSLVMSFLSETIMPRNEFYTNINTSKYEHGKVDWSGEAEMALKEVIPTYLAAITSALTGGSMTHYDYKRGAFVKRSNVKNLNDDRMAAAGRAAGGDFRFDAIRVIGKLNGASDKDKKDLEKEIDAFFTNAFKDKNFDVSTIYSTNFNYAKYGLSPESYAIIKSVLKAYGDKDVNLTRRATAWASNMVTGKEKYSDDTRSIEEGYGDAILRHVFNNSDAILENSVKRAGGLIGVDNYGNDIWYYLQEIRESNWLIADGYGGERDKNKKPSVRGIRNANAEREVSNTLSGERGGKYSDNDLYSLAMEVTGGSRKIGERTTRESNKAIEAANDANNLLGIKGQNKEREKESDSAISKMLETFFGKDSRIKTGFDKIFSKVNGIFNAPATIISEILASGEVSMYRLIYGNDEVTEGREGLFGYFFRKADDLFKTFDDQLHKKFEAAGEWFKKLFAKVGGEGFVADTKNELKNVGKWFVNKGKSTLGLGGRPGVGETAPIDQAAYGRKVTKTGIVAVSEGELIIPSKYNPYYHGNTNQVKQSRDERKAIDRFYGSFASGGTVGGSPEDYVRFWEEDVVYDDEGNVKTGRSNRNNRVKAAQNMDSFNLMTLLKGSMSQFVNGFQDFANTVIPKDQKKDFNLANKILGQENAKKLKDANIKDEVISNRGAIGAGALIGGGVSLLTGAVVGPLAGAAIGGAVGLAVKSGALQNALFGKGGEDGDRTGGILNKKVTDFMTKQLPDIGFGGGVGAVAGLFMGSPLIGAMVGATIGYATKSDKIKNWLFGEFDDDGKRTGGAIPKDIQDKIKKAAPSIGAGAIAGLAFGPVGLVGNLVLGSAIGYATTSETFQNMILGKKGEDGTRTGGLAGYLKTEIENMSKNTNSALGQFREYMKGVGQDFKAYFIGGNKDRHGNEKEGILDSIKGIFMKIGAEITRASRNIFKNTGSMLRKLITRGMKSTVGQWIGGTGVGKAIKGVGKAAVSVAKSPFALAQNTLGGINTKLGKSQLRRGMNLRNKDGSLMTAAERTEWRNKNGLTTETGRDRNANLDAYLSSLENEDQLNEFIKTMEYMEDPTKEFDWAELSQKTKFAQTLDTMNVDAKVARRLEKAAASKKTDAKASDRFEQALAESGLSKEQQESIRAQYSDIRKTRSDRASAEADVEKYKSDLMDRTGLSKFFLGTDGIDVHNADSIRDILDKAKAEQSRLSKSPEQIKIDAEEKQDKDNHDNIASISDNVHNIVLCLTGRKDQVKIGGGSITKAADEAADNASSTDLDPDNSDKVTVATENGLEVYNRDDKTGELEPDTADPRMKEATEYKDTKKKGFLALAGVGGVFGTLSGAIGSLKDGLLGTEQSEGLFSKLFSTFLGDNSFLGGIFNTVSKLFGGSGLTTLASGVIGTVGSLLPSAALAAAFSGVFDDAFASLTTALGLSGNDTTDAMSDNTSQTYTTSDGTTYNLATDDDGNLITNENGEYLTTTGEYVSGGLINNQGVDNSLSTQLKKNLVTGAIMGTGSVASKVVSKTVSKLTGTAVASSGTLASTLTDVATSGASSSLISGIMSAVSGALEKIPQIMKAVPFLKNYADYADDIVTAIYCQVDDVVQSASTKLASIASAASTALVALKVVTIAGSVINAWGNAESILGITDDATTGQRIIACLVALVNALLPFIGNLIPNKVWVNIFMNIAPKLGIDVSSLEEQRAAAEAEVAAYNEENGTDYSIEEYNQMNGKAGIITKAKNAVSSAITNIKEQGLVTTVKNYAASKVAAFKEGLEEGGLSEAVSSLISSIIPGTLGDIAGNFGSMATKAFSGDFSGYMSSSLLDVDEDSGAVMKVANTAISTVAKIPLLVPAMLTVAGKAIANLVSGTIDKIKSGIQTVMDEKDYMKSLLSDTSSSLSDVFTVEDDEGNPIGGITKVLRVGIRLASLPSLLISKAGEKLANFFSEKVVAPVKTAITNIANMEVGVRDYAYAGDVSGMWGYTATDTEGNPLGGVFNIMTFMNKLYCTPLALFKAAANAAMDFLTEKVITPVKSAILTIDSVGSDLRTYASEGDISSIWSYSAEDDEGNPLGGIFGATTFLTKISYTPLALFKKAGNAIGSFFSSKIDAAKTDYTNMSSVQTSMAKYAENGEIASVWNSTFESSEDNILAPIYNGIFNIQKVFYTLSAIMKKVFGLVSDLVGGVVDKISGTVSNITSTVTNAASSVKEGVTNAASSAWSAVTNWFSGSGSGLRSRRYTGGSSGNSIFVSQLDDKYKDIKYSNSTIGDIGCAPAAATMLANYVKPGSTTMTQAIRDAEGYQQVNGTSADYFGSVLEKNGLDSAYVDTSKSTGRNSVEDQLAAGHPAILLGKDDTNTSKKNSPFGPNNHYVMAEGFDKSGKLIINDPENNTSATYNKNILKNVSLGILTNQATIDGDPELGGSVGGATSYPDNSITQNVWGYLTGLGYSPQTTASIMGNLYQESGIDPTKLQSGKGPAAGIAQWENYTKKSSRWKNLYDTATAAGKDWTDLETQLAFLQSELTSTDIKNRMSGKTAPSNLTKVGATAMSYDNWKVSTDIDNATRLFEGAFERAGKPNMDARLKAAEAYYNMYSGSTYTGSFNYDSTTSSSSDSTTTSSDSGLSGILSSIGTAIGSIFSAITGSTSSSDSDSTTSTTSDSVGTVYTGLGGTGTASQQQQNIVDMMDSIKGTISYSMSGARDPDKGSADCSSTANWAYKKATGKSVGTSTLGQYSDSNTSWVDFATSGMNKTSGGTNSSGPNEANLQAGDLMLWSRPTSSYTSGRPYRVGHVGVYSGNGQMIHHPGPGKGPSYKSITADGKRYIGSKRLNDFISSTSGSGSGLPTVDTLHHTAAKIKRAIGGASDISSTTTTSTTSTATVSNTQAITLLQGILKAVESIASNTGDLQSLGTTITNYCKNKLGTEVSTDTTSSPSTSSSKSSTVSSSTKVDPSKDTGLNNLIGTLQQIAYT